MLFLNKMRVFLLFARESSVKIQFPPSLLISHFERNPRLVSNLDDVTGPQRATTYNVYLIGGGGGGDICTSQKERLYLSPLTYGKGVKVG